MVDSDESDDPKLELVGFALSSPSPELAELRERFRASMETALDCVRLLLADGAQLRAAAAAGILISDDDTTPVIGDVAPHLPVDQLRAATQTDQTVAEILSELNELVTRSPTSASS